jgi:hypothetical protein
LGETNGVIMKNKKKLITVSAIFAVFALSVILYLYYKGTSGKFLFNYKTGFRYTYSIHYKSETATSILSPDKTSEIEIISGKMDYDLDFVLRPVMQKDNKVFIGFSFINMRNIYFLYSGENLFEDKRVQEEAYSGKEAFFAMDDKGVISDIYFFKGESILFKSAVKLFLGEIQIILKETLDEWISFENTQYGKTESKYTFIKSAADKIILEKTRIAYPAVNNLTIDQRLTTQNANGKWEIFLDRSGHLQSFSGKEELTVTDRNGRNAFHLKTDFTLKLKSVEKDTATLQYEENFFRKMTPSVIGTIEFDKKMEEEALKNRAKEMTRSEMLKTLKTFSEEGEIYNQQMFWWRVSGYLKLYPERSADLVDLFKEKGFDSKARLFIVGILASVGHSEAQKAMRDIIVSDEAKNDGLYVMMLQNFSLLENPDKGTVDLVKSIYDDAFAQKNIIRAASSLTLGALAGRLNSDDNAAAAHTINEKLLLNLRYAEDDKEKEYLLDALGNTRIESNIKIASKFIDNRKDEIRASVANAVRNNQTPESENILFKLTQDDKTIVQRQALSALNNYRLEEDHFKKINEQIRSKKIGDNLYLDVVQLLMKYPDKIEDNKDMLEYMRDSAPYNTHLKARINSILKNTENH